MTKVSDLYVEGYAKPLGQWTDNALTQLRSDIRAVLENNPSKKAKLELYETYCVIEAEQDRRKRELEPQAIEAPQRRPLLSLFKRAQEAELPDKARGRASPETVRDVGRDGGRDANDTLEPKGGGLEP